MIGNTEGCRPDRLFSQAKLHRVGGEIRSPVRKGCNTFSVVLIHSIRIKSNHNVVAQSWTVGSWIAVTSLPRERWEAKQRGRTQ